MKALHLTEAAEADLQRIEGHLLQATSLKRALGVMDALEAGFAFVAEYPLACPVRADLGGPHMVVRAHPVDAYVLFYIVQDAVVVLRVLHGREDPAQVWP